MGRHRSNVGSSIFNMKKKKIVCLLSAEVMKKLNTLFKKRNDIDFQSLITKLLDMIQATKSQDSMGRGLLCTYP